jgi:hypothetical protein
LADEEVKKNVDGDGNGVTPSVALSFIAVNVFVFICEVFHN